MDEEDKKVALTIARVPLVIVVGLVIAVVIGVLIFNH
jgi:high-affinity Fe2+/Pb2+ permease